MKINSVFSKSFTKFGQVIQGMDSTEFVQTLNKISEKPQNGTIYVASAKELEELKLLKQLKDNVYGGMDIQAGYVNGSNTKLNSFECHIGSEINIPCDDIILLLAPLSALKKDGIKSSCAKAFRVPKGTIIRLYETTLHFAPCNNVVKGKDYGPYRVGIILLRGTNTQRPQDLDAGKVIFQKNKWLYSHPESPQAKEGAFVCVKGKNIDLLK